MNEQRLIQIVQGRLQSARTKLTVEKNVGVIWYLNHTPDQLPTGRYTGLIFHPQTGKNCCVVFSVTKKDRFFYDDHQDWIIQTWVNPGKIVFKQQWLEPTLGSGKKPNNLLVRTQSGVDKYMEI